ncbi:MAG TPA: alpha/beta hydrolase [Opitutaceae bacterium]|nr:alpha/beta hydrolase [Opitutaceae bacterium]
MKAFGLILCGSLLAGAGWARAQERLVRDLEYGCAGGESLRLDACVPGGPGPHPVAILVHGGGWSGGDKSGSNHPGDGADISPWFAPLTAAKFTWFSINYRLAPAHRWPACFEDVQTAIRWVKAHAAEYGGDPGRIALFGHSAGGHLVCLAGTEPTEDTRVQAVVGFAPVTDFEYELPIRGGLSKSLQGLLDRPQAVTPEALAILRAMAPINHVKRGLPPFLLVQGDADKTVPIQESRNFAAKLQTSGVTCDLVVIPGAPHRLLSWDQFDPHYAENVIAWLRKVLGEGPVSSAPPPAQ